MLNKQLFFRLAFRLSKFKSQNAARKIFISLCGLFLFSTVFAAAASAQRKTAGNPVSPSLVVQQTADEEEETIKPSRPGVADPAEIQKPGVLQIEYGYDSNFRADEFRDRQLLPLNIRFAATSRLLLEAEIETVETEREFENGRRETGVGDSRFGFQIVALKDTEKYPALAFAYIVKAPTASEEKRLGTGRVDHRVIALLGKQFGEKTDLEINVAYLNVGRDDSSKRADGGQGAISVSHEFKNDFGFEVELSGQSLEDVQPRGVFALGALTYKVNKRLRFDAGTRFGLNPSAPRVGVFAGFSVGIGKGFNK